MIKSNITKAGERYKEISDLVENDAQGSRFLSKTVDSAGRYVKHVVDMEAELKDSKRKV
jgi:hypothetical protein